MILNGLERFGKCRESELSETCFAVSQNRVRLIIDTRRQKAATTLESNRTYSGIKGWLVSNFLLKESNYFVSIEKTAPFIKTLTLKNRARRVKVILMDGFSDVDDRIAILLTSFGCWCLTLMYKDSGRCRRK